MDPTNTPKAATLKEIKAACPGADEKFICTQLEAEATVEAAATAWMTAQQAKITELQAAVTAAAATGNKPGVKPPKPGKTGKKQDAKPCDDDMEDADDSDPEDVENMEPEDVKALFERTVQGAISARMKSGRMTNRRDVVLAIANKHPALHQAWLATSNPTLQGKRLIAEKYDNLPKPKK
jgi:hypothetical protein